MNVRTFRSDRQTLLDEGRRIASTNDDAIYLRRVTIVSLMLHGASAAALSPFCGESARTLSAWVKAVDEQGFEALRPRKRTGRPRRLTDQQRAEMRDALQGKPHASGYPVWDGPALSDFIRKTYSIDLSVRQCQRLLHELEEQDTAAVPVAQRSL